MRLIWLVLVLVGVAFCSGCKKKKAQTFSCHAYQERMERCQNEVLAAIKRRFDADVRSGFEKPAEATRQRKLLQRRIQKRVRRKNSLRRCEKLSRLSDRRYRKQYSTLRYCFRRTGCRAFAECMLTHW